MLKKRIIPTLLFDGSLQCVKPISFGRPYRKLGPMNQYIRVMENRNVDEIILLDITATAENREPNIPKIRELTTRLHCPITYGGGISTLEHIRDILANGADKVAIRTSMHLFGPASHKFGSQAIVAVINRNKYINAVQYAKDFEAVGAGEILLTDVNKDGTQEGYNNDLVMAVSSAVGVPVIANGGCGNIAHMAQAFQAGASAVAAGSMFLYSEITPKKCAEILQGQFRVPVRIHG
jgi:cyclase